MPSSPLPPGSSGARPRVLFVTFNFPPKLGGLEQVVLEVWQALGERAEVITLAQRAPETRAEPGVLRSSWGGLLGLFAFVLVRGLGLARRQRFDVIVAGSALVALPVWALARASGSRAAVIVYGLDVVYDSWLYQAVFRAIVPRFQRVVAISRATAEEAVARGVPRERIEIVAPGCHGERFARERDSRALRERWGLGDAPVVLSAGRLVKRKGMDRFVRECLPAIVARVPDARLLLAGANPEGAHAHREDMAREVMAAAREVGLEGHVVMTGRLDDAEMSDAFHAADVFVLPVIPRPADMEGFGIVLLEAACAGLPAVASRIGGIPDALEDGVSGVLVPPLDYPALADALVRFLEDAAHREAFAARARERALTRFDWSAVAPRYAEALLRG